MCCHSNFPVNTTFFTAIFSFKQQKLLFVKATFALTQLKGSGNFNQPWMFCLAASFFGISKCNPYLPILLQSCLYPLLLFAI